jgi:heme/copper-type cytochrome/quinol oxidase subunit 2
VGDSSEGSSQHHTNRQVLRFTLAAAPLAFAVFFPQLRPTSTQEQRTQVIELKAKKYEFAPSPIHVRTGNRVLLKITAVDHDHGFRILTDPEGIGTSGKPGLVLASPQDCWLLKKGETTTIEFLAQTPGTYLFWCCHTCGLGHREMKSEIVVE